MNATTPTDQPRSLLDGLLSVKNLDPDTRRRGKSLHLWNGISILGLLVALFASWRQGALDDNPVAVLAPLGIALVAFLISYLATRQGRVELAARILLITWLLTVGSISFFRGANSPVILFSIVPIVTAGTILSPRSGLFAGGVFGAYYLLLVALERGGTIEGTPLAELAPQVHAVYPTLMVVTGVVVWLLARSLNQAFEERQEYAQQLEKGQSILEEEVKQRTRELREANRQLTVHAQQMQVSAEIGQAATQLLNLNQLLPRAAELIQAQAGYYQVSIFLLNEEGNRATIRSSCGTGGTAILDEVLRIELGSQNVVGQAMANLQPYIVPDVNADPCFLAHPLLPNTKSEVALPLVVGKKLLGAVDIQSQFPNAFEDQTISVLQAITNQLAVAIDNALKFMDEASVLAESSAFYRYSREVSLATNLDQICKALMAFTASTPVDVARLLLVEKDPKTKHSWIVLTDGWSRDDRPSQPLGTRLLLRDYPLGKYISEREAITIEDVQTDPSVDETALMTLKIEGVRSIALIPFHSGEKWLGSWFIGRNEPSVFEPRLLRSYQSMAQQAAVVMDNIRLIETTQYQARRERIISTVGTELRSQVLTEQVLKSAVNQIGAQLGASRAAIRLHTELGDNNGKELQKA